MFGNKNQPKPDLEAFVIYDSKVEAYDQPTFAINHLDFVRQMTNMLSEQRQKNRLFINAEDYSLFKIGSYDKKSGQLITHSPTHVLNFHELRSSILAQDQAPN